MPPVFVKVLGLPFPVQSPEVAPGDCESLGPQEHGGGGGPCVHSLIVGLMEFMWLQRGTGPTGKRGPLSSQVSHSIRKQTQLPVPAGDHQWLETSSAPSSPALGSLLLLSIIPKAETCNCPDSPSPDSPPLSSPHLPAFTAQPGSSSPA